METAPAAVLAVNAVFAAVLLATSNVFAATFDAVSTATADRR